MGIMPKAVAQVRRSEVRAVFGEKVWSSVVKMAKTLKDQLEGNDTFTGKIVFTLDCRDGGIGRTEAFIQEKITEKIGVS